MDMTATLISPSGAMLHHRARRSTTPSDEAGAKAVRVWFRKELRLEENRIFLKHRNVRAFLRAVSTTLGAPGGAVGAYGLDAALWADKAAAMGLAASGPGTGAEADDLVAIELLRELDLVDKLQAGDVWAALLAAASRWPALPRAPGADGRFTPPATDYEAFCALYKRFGGTVNELAGALSFGRRLQGRPMPDAPASANDG